MTVKLAALTLALSLGATLVYAQDSIDPKTGKKRGPLEVWRDRDRPNKAPATAPTPTPAPVPHRDISRVHDHDRDRDVRYRAARLREHERRERIERERRERFERERRERDRRERFERARATEPHGWSKGKKTGWGNSHMPPGQAKKDEDRRHGHPHHKERG